MDLNHRPLGCECNKGWNCNNLPKSGRKASAFQAGDIKAPLVFSLPFVLESLPSTRPMAGHGQKSSSLSSAEVGRLWEEPTEETSPKRGSVGILAACGAEDVNGAMRS